MRILKRFFALSLAALILMIPSSVWADQGTASLEERLSKLEAENETLKSRIVVLEQSAASKEIKSTPAQPVTPEKPKPEAVMLDKIGTKLKINGRWATTFYKSGQGGSFPNGSFEVPDAKIQLIFNPDDINTLVSRFNLNNAAFNNVDFFYIDSKLFQTRLKDSPYTLESRIGRFKIPFGEATYWDNPVGSSVASGSATKINGNDEGVQLSGSIGKEKPLKWYFGLMNGNSGTGSDNTNAKAFIGKLSYSPVDPLRLSASIYNTGNLKTAASDISVAGLTARPGNATNWDRTLWELDARYDFEKGKVLDPPSYADSKAYLQAAFGQMIDDARNVPDREGSYGFIEGLYNFTPKYYGAMRYSLISLWHGYFDTLNGANGTTQYDRYSLAVGYRVSDKTIVKLAYDFNFTNTMNGGDDPTDDLLTAAIVSYF